MYDLIRKAHVRQATPRDFPIIEAWRAQHIAKMRNRGCDRELEQEPISTAAWAVYVDADDFPLAAVGFRDEPQTKRRWGQGLYREQSPRGVLALKVLADLFEEMSDVHGYEIRGSTDPENVDYLERLLGRGYEITAVCYRRVPRGCDEQRPAAESSGESADPGQHAAGAREPAAVAHEQPRADAGREAGSAAAAV